MKTVDSILLSHLGEQVTTTCTLLRVGPLADGRTMGFTDLDREITYNDGNGEIEYEASSGEQLANFNATADLGVDNTEVATLMPVYGSQGVTQADIDRGVFDKAPFVLYRINFEDPTTGRHEVLASGFIGRQVSKRSGLAVLELRSLSNLLKQNIIELDSLTCRVKKFGSQPGEERFPCEFDIDTLWVTGTVTAVDPDEPDRNFTSGLAQPSSYFVPGIVEFTSGSNAGIEREVESFSGGETSMLFVMPYTIQIGDTFRIRKECNRSWAEEGGCTTFWAADKPLHFRGEPYIPLADSGLLTVPGAALPGNVNGTGEPTDGA